MKPAIRNRWARAIWGRYGIRHIQRYHGRTLYSRPLCCQKSRGHPVGNVTQLE